MQTASLLPPCLGLKEEGFVVELIFWMLELGARAWSCSSSFQWVMQHYSRRYVSRAYVFCSTGLSSPLHLPSFFHRERQNSFIRQHNINIGKVSLQGYLLLCNKVWHNTDVQETVFLLFVQGSCKIYKSGLGQDDLLVEGLSRLWILEQHLV